MEIFLYFTFFFNMIFLSYLTWGQIFSLFLFSIIFVHCYFNYDHYYYNDNLIMYSISFILDLFILSWNFIKLLWNVFSQTRIGNRIYRLFVYLENCYQLTKSKIIKNILFRFLNFNRTRILNTPRVSYDSEATDSD